MLSTKQGTGDSVNSKKNEEIKNSHINDGSGFERPNTASYYNEQQIIKVWDSYVTSKHLQYYCGDREGSAGSLFKDQAGMMVSHKAGILLNKNGRLYKSKRGEGDTISVCGRVDYMSNTLLQGGYNGITGDMGDALEQISQWNKANPGNLIEQHTIMFPYHLNAAHWCLGSVELGFVQDGRLNKATIRIIDPLNNGAKVNDHVENEIRALIKKVLGTDVELVSEPVAGYKPQQNDGSSCGVISAENGKDIIDGENTQRIEYIYEQGSEELRQNHLKEVNSQRFNEMQLRNENWGNPTFVPPEDIGLIASAFQNALKELRKSKEEEVQTLLKGLEKVADPTVRALATRDFVSKNADLFAQVEIVKGHNLVDRLFKDNGGVLGFII